MNFWNPVYARTRLSLITCGLVLVLAGCGRAPAPPVTVDFARLTRGEPLSLGVGDSFTLVGYPPEAVEVAAQGIVEFGAEGAAEGGSPRTTLVAAAQGETEITVTQNLCEGVSTCSGPALFLRLQVQVHD